MYQVLEEPEDLYALETVSGSKIYFIFQKEFL